MGFPEEPTLTRTEKRNRAYLQVTRNILLGMGNYLEGVVKFILHLVLYLIDVLEALTSVLLQVFRVVKLLVRALFTFGVLLQFVGRSFGAVGSFVFVLSLVTYCCFWSPNSFHISSISGFLHMDVCIVTLGAWVLAIPIVGFLVFVRLRKKIKKQIELLVNYDELYENGSEYVDKSTETATVLAPRVDRTSSSSSPDQGRVSKELLAEILGEILGFKDPVSASGLTERNDSSSSLLTPVSQAEKNSSSSEGTAEKDETGKEGKGKKSVSKDTQRRKRKYRES